MNSYANDSDYRDRAKKLSREHYHSDPAYAEATRARARKRYEQFKDDPDYLARRNLYRFRYQLKQYGMTIEDYETMYEAQAGMCAICGLPPSEKRLSIDHCHDTKEVRGLLCTRCNSGIGFLQHEGSLLRKAAAYLDESRTKTRLSSL